MVIYIALAVIFVVVIAFILYKKKGAKKMPQGLQVFNQNGGIVFDTTDISYVIYGLGETTGMSGQILDDKIDENSFIFIYYYDANITDQEVGGVYPERTFEGYGGNGKPLFKIEQGKISWTYNSRMGVKIRYKFFYGGVPK